MFSITNVPNSSKFVRDRLKKALYDLCLKKALYDLFYLETFKLERMGTNSKTFMLQKGKDQL